MRDSTGELLEIGDIVSHSTQGCRPVLKQVIGFSGEDKARISGNCLYRSYDGTITPMAHSINSRSSVVSPRYIVKVFNQSIKELF